MDRGARDYPPGDLRVSDAERDRALSELSEAFQAGRITSEEFDERSGQVLRARTGRELTALLADLPRAGVPGTRAAAASGETSGDMSTRPSSGLPARRIGIGAVALGAIAIAAIVGAVANSGQHAVMFGHHSGLGGGGGGLIMALVIVLIVMRVARRRR